MTTEAVDGSRLPSPPRGTAKPGRELWRSVLGQFDLEEHELALLREIVRTVDALDRLAAIVLEEGDVITDDKGNRRAHPASVEARQLRIALARLQAALRLPDGDAGDQSANRRPQRRVGARGIYQIKGGAA